MLEIDEIKSRVYVNEHKVKGKKKKKIIKNVKVILKLKLINYSPSNS